MNTWKIIRWVVIASALIAWAWSIWPGQKVERIFFVSTPNELIQNKNDCVSLGKLINSSFSVRYPKFLRYLDQDSLVMIINPDQSFVEKSGEKCAVVLETYLDVQDADIRPGARIFEPISSNPNQMITYQITADRRTKNIEGNLWIHAIVTFNRQMTHTEQRIPLFVIPLQIGLIDVLGIPFQFLRLIFICLAVMLSFGHRIMNFLK